MEEVLKLQLKPQQLNFKAMIRKLICSFFIIFCVVCFGQSSKKIIYLNSSKATPSILNEFPAELQPAIKKQYESLKYESTINFSENISYFETFSQQKEVVKKGEVGKANNPQVSHKDLSTTLTTANNKYSIDLKKNRVTEIKDGKLISEALIKLKWQLTSKTKTILGYKCYEAKAKDKKQSITVYFTKEISGTIIPLKMLFSEGVVLELSTETKHCIATKISLNEPPVSDFFKNK
jgi:GLPGLI family protein